MRIATFNINDINKRLQNLLAWLEKTEPDVVCLQELKAEQRAFPAEALRALGYEAVWEGELERWPNDKGMRLDHFLLSPQLSECLVGGGVERCYTKMNIAVGDELTTDYGHSAKSSPVANSFDLGMGRGGTFRLLE